MAASSSQDFLENGISEEPLEILVERTRAAWAKLNLLTLDGGGIRGYWSLLALHKLMGCIAEVEEERSTEENDHCHSFYPQGFPDHVSHVTRSEEETNRLDRLHSHEHFRALDKEKRYLPCHYFDYMGGTSTGGLIAIMLGRLRMTVPDCIQEYETFGDEIFGNPRHLTALNLAGIVSRSKYDAHKLEQVFRNVTERRGERTDEVEPLRFRSKTNTCRCFVTALKASADKKGNKKSGTIQLIRSYDSDKTDADSRNNTQRPRGTTRSRSTSSPIDSRPRDRARGQPFMKMGPADNFEIWEVARAATAAPYYFDPIKIQIQGRSEVIIFEDGGLGETTNPTLYGIRDIKKQEGVDAVGIVVSVGTARGELGRQKDLILGRAKHKLKTMIWNSSDPESVHRTIEGDQDHYPNMEYWRLNPSARGDGQLLNMPLDEWVPKQTRKQDQPSGSRTINEIKNAFNKWASQTSVHDDLMVCAERLVEQRRLRTLDDVQWERFSMAMDYRCCQRGCPKKSRAFTNLQDFEEHLKKIHRLGTVSEIKENKNASAQPWQYRRPDR